MKIWGRVKCCGPLPSYSRPLGSTPTLTGVCWPGCEDPGQRIVHGKSLLWAQGGGESWQGRKRQGLVSHAMLEIGTLS